MSTIVYRDGIMAADTRAYAGDPSPIGRKSKIKALRRGGVVGVSTRHPGLAEQFTAWLDGGPEPDSFEVTALHVTHEGKVFYYAGGTHPSGPLEGDFFAIGSGLEGALGAMINGADALGAVATAAMIDPWTSAPFETLTVADCLPQVVEQVEEKPKKKRKGWSLKSQH